MENQDISDLIKHQIQFTETTAGGAHTLKCPMCGDSTVRAAFFFVADHIGFNCFRGKCSFKTAKWVFSQPISSKFRQLMSALNVQLPADVLLKKNNTLIEIESDESYYKIPNLEKVIIPEDFERYDPKKHTKYAEYLDSRGMSDVDYYVSTAGIMEGMLVTPFYLNGIMYGYQGRHINKKQFKSYGNLAFYANNGVIHDSPIIVEGIWDAKSIPFGVAILHDSVNPYQAHLLRNKNPILLPDRDTTKFLEVAKKYNWRICVPSWDSKDANEALIKYGRLAVAKMIHDGICKNLLEAEIRYKMWCGKNI